MITGPMSEIKTIQTDLRLQMRAKYNHFLGRTDFYPT